MMRCNEAEIAAGSGGVSKGGGLRAGWERWRGRGWTGCWQAADTGQVINQMQRNEPKQQPALNFFALNRLKPHCHYPLTRVDFNSPPAPRSVPISILPVFNHDSQFFTPSFILPGDKNQKIGAKMEEELARSEQREGGQEEVELRSSESRFCQVCQTSFPNYWAHIGEKTHVRKMSQSHANLHIDELCRGFQPHSTAPLPSPSTSKTTKKRRRNQDPALPQRCASQCLLKTQQASFSTQIQAQYPEVLRL